MRCFEKCPVISGGDQTELVARNVHSSIQNIFIESQYIFIYKRPYLFTYLLPDTILVLHKATNQSESLLILVRGTSHKQIECSYTHRTLLYIHDDRGDTCYEEKHNSKNKRMLLMGGKYFYISPMGCSGKAFLKSGI